MSKTNRDVICLATGSTYDIVLDTAVTAHPARSPYPKPDYSYLIPIRKGGYLERLYDVCNYVECKPGDVEKQKAILPDDQYERLLRYHTLRSRSFGYGDDEEPYRYYILHERAAIKQPFQRRNIQVSTRIELSSAPLVEDEK